MAPLRLLFVEPDLTSATFMRHMLTRAGYQVSHTATAKEGLIVAWRDQPDVIILELELPDLDALDVVRRLRSDSRTSNKEIIALTTHAELETSNSAHEAGVDEIILKQSDAVDLLLRTLAESRSPIDEIDTHPLRPGRLVSFLSAKGGVGTSSLCMNVAHLMSQREPDTSTVVLDQVLPLGFLGRIAGVQSPIDIVHLTTSVEPYELTPDFLRINLPAPTPWQFRLVSGARDPIEGAKLDADRLAPALQSLRSAFGRVVVDLGRTLSPLTIMTLRQTDLIVIVFSPTPDTVASTSAVLHYLRHEGIGRERLLMVSNRPLGIEDDVRSDTEKVLNRKVDFSFPNVGQDMYLSNRMHMPMESRVPDSEGTRQLGKLTKYIMDRQLELRK